jgi:hypothetical protein
MNEDDRLTLTLTGDQNCIKARHNGVPHYGILCMSDAVASCFASEQIVHSIYRLSQDTSENDRDLSRNSVMLTIQKTAARYTRLRA